jgi:hypothetical protein
MAFLEPCALSVRRFALGAALMLPAAPALALGGSEVSTGGRDLSAHTVMVLGARGSVCTGTLIARNVVITAAHCVAGSKQIAVAYHEAGQPILQLTTGVATNPGFSKNAKVSLDLALLRLQENMPMRFSPARLDGGGAAQAVGDNLTIAGFGLSVETDPKSAGTLRTAEVRLLPRLFPRFLRVGLDGDLSRLAICKGDSGGPVFATVNGGRVLAGVVYAAEKTGKATICGAAAQAVRVAPQRGWIDRVLSQWGAVAGR